MPSQALACSHIEYMKLKISIHTETFHTTKKGEQRTIGEEADEWDEKKNPLTQQTPTFGGAHGRLA